MRSRQSGFTLVEILVALLIAVFLLFGLVTMTQNNKTTYSNQSALAQLQDNQRFALSIMNDVIQQAGYFPDPTVHGATDDMPPIGSFTAAGQPLYGTPQIVGTQAATIGAQYSLANQDTVLTCAGQQNTGAMTAFTNTFAIVPPPDAQHPMDGQLTCTVETSAGAQPPVILVTGVTDMQIRYGINDTGAVTTHDVTQYKTADQMAGTDWMNVTSVQVTLTFANPLAYPPNTQLGQSKTIDIIRTIGVMTRAGVTT
ncbi:MAG TPA: PilW family protein [Steroidobacteraceae bacterium]|jgi:type IV pilus assembly protein PilW|nr:PilW family protein [Steroidobacteraceae bacterium]